MRRLLVGAIVALVGCGSAEKPTIQGGWLTQIDDTCALGIGFQPGAYLLQFICLRGSNSADVQANRGTYTDDGNGNLVIRPELTTCPNDPREADPYPATYSLRDSDTMVFSFPTEGLVLSMNRSKASGKSDTGFVVRFGCFEKMSFTAGGLRPATR